jgi:hypothetical protein
VSVSISLRALKISASTVELGSGDDVWIGTNLVFDNDLWVKSSLCALKISASTEELDTDDDLWVDSDSISSTIYESAVV